MRVAVLLFLCGAASAEEATAILHWRNGAVARLGMRFTAQPEPPAGVTLPAAERIEGFSFVRFALGDRAMVTLSVSSDAFYFDQDLDGDLAEEPRTPWSGPPAKRYRTVHMEVPFRGVIDPVPVEAQLLFSPASNVLEVRVRAYRSGHVVLAGRRRLVQAIDHDGDLRYLDPDKDILFFDLDGDGRLSGEEVRAGIPFRVGTRGFIATVPDTAGGRVVFRETDEVPPPPRRSWSARSIASPGVRARGGDLAKAAHRVDSSTSYLRRQAAYRIGSVGTPAAFDLLWKLYRNDEVLKVREAAVRSMGYREYHEHVGALAKIAGAAREPTLRSAALASLHGMGAPADVYIKLLAKTKDESAFQQLVHGLAATKTEVAREKLLDAAQRHPRAACRYHAYLYGTRYFRTPPTEDQMRAASKAADHRLVALALRDLHYFRLPDARPMALAATREKINDNDLALIVTEILATAGDADAVRAVLPLAEMESQTLQGRLLDLLRPVRDPGGIEALTRGLAAHSPEVRQLCAAVLADIATPAVARAMSVQLSRERVQGVALALIEGLAKHGGAEGAAAIVDAAGRHERDDVLSRAILRALADLGMEHEPVRDYFERKLESGSWETRVLAIGAAARAELKTAVPAILGSLDHAKWQVRLAAVRAFRRLRVREAIQPLIGRLGEESERRIQRAIGDTLQGLTGQNFFSDYELWARWWRDAREGFSVPAETDPAPARTKGTRTVAFYGLLVDSDRVCFVIDQSGSMSSRRGDRNEYEHAADELMRVADRLKSGAKMNVILFETHVHPWRKRLVGVNSGSRAALEKHLESNGPTGGTNLFDALEMALQHKEVDTIYLLSDGIPGDGKFVYENDIVREVRRINELKGITLHCVSLGRESTLLKRLATENGGRYVRR